MSNSSLASFWVKADSSNYYSSRLGSSISEITIHHMAARLTAQRCGELFQNPNRNASSHYGIGYDGTIAQYVDEKYGAWTNSSKTANCRAVTIETANDSTGGNWPVNDVTLRSLINLVADIAKRNDLVPLVKGKNLTWHQMYSATACPGPYLLSRLDYIVEEANKIINGNSNVVTTRTPVTITYQAYDGAWLSNITGYDANNAKAGFAGVIGRPMSGIYANASIGNVYYRVHQKGGSWLPEVKNREDYAGNLGKPIDGFMIKSDSTRLTYRAHDKTHGWLSEISGYDVNNASTGYAGWTGYEIDAIMIKADDIVTTAIIEKPKDEPTAPSTPSTQELYRIRLTWEDSKSQVGAYKNIDSAKKICQETTDTTGKIYTVFDSKGEAVYVATVKASAEPEEPKVEVVEPAPAPEAVTAVYDLDYPDKVLIVDKTVKRTEEDCVKAIKAIKANNIDFDANIAKAFFKLGIIYGIDPLVAIAQSVLETGWFKYNGSAVKPEHHNYCGLGVTSNGITGGIFDTIENGVHAQYQHLFAYGSKENLPSDTELLDPRFKYVTRGIALYWQQLAGRWAVPGYDKTKYEKPIDAMNAGNTYGQKILVISDKIKATEVSKEEIELYFKKEEPKVEEPKVEEPKVEEPLEPGTPVIDIPAAEQPVEIVTWKEKLAKIIVRLIDYLLNLFKTKGE